MQKPSQLKPLVLGFIVKFGKSVQFSPEPGFSTQLLQRNWQDMESPAWRGHCNFDKILRMTQMRFIATNSCP
jgi:hypothetical protein